MAEVGTETLVIQLDTREPESWEESPSTRAGAIMKHTPRKPRPIPDMSLSLSHDK